METTRTTLELAWWPPSESIRTHLCVSCILATATIQGRHLFHSELSIVRLLFEGGVYLRAVTIWGWWLFEEIQYPSCFHAWQVGHTCTYNNFSWRILTGRTELNTTLFHMNCHYICTIKGCKNLTSVCSSGRQLITFIQIYTHIHTVEPLLTDILYSGHLIM